MGSIQIIAQFQLEDHLGKRLIHVRPTRPHHCVTNMPCAVGRTISRALCNATLPYVERIASLGIELAARKDPGLARGINIRAGQVTYKGVAETLGLEWCTAT